MASKNKNRNKSFSISLFKTIIDFLTEIIVCRNLFPEAQTGRPRIPLQQLLKSFLFMMLRGLTWRELEEYYKICRSTAHRYFTRLATEGVFEDLWKSIVLYLIENGYRNCEFLIVDGSDRTVKNMLTGVADIGFKHKGKNAIKITLVVTQDGLPMGISIGKASTHDSKALEPAFKSLVEITSKEAIVNVVADKAYIGDPAKIEAADQHLNLITPVKKGENRFNTLADEKLLAQRGVVEKSFARLYQFRRIANIYDKTIQSYTNWCYLALAFLTFTIF